jgi:hypothetical protein
MSTLKRGCEDLLQTLKAPAAPLARRQRRALPLSGPPGIDVGLRRGGGCVVRGVHDLTGLQMGPTRVSSWFDAAVENR